MIIKDVTTTSEELTTILKSYADSFSVKQFTDMEQGDDVLMNIFGITQETKIGNKQYWGRELGMCWQLIIDKFIQKTIPLRYSPPEKYELDAPTDLFIDKDAIDTKYRIGSGDSGTLKKFKTYGKLLKDKGYNPILLILRTDNLNSAIHACKKGGWQVYTGQETFHYLKEKTGEDLDGVLSSLKDKFPIISNQKV